MRRWQVGKLIRVSFPVRALGNKGWLNRFQFRITFCVDRERQGDVNEADESTGKKFSIRRG